MRKRIVSIAIALLLGLQTVPASAWEFSVPEDADALVRTYCNPKFGVFDVFLPASNDQRSWDIQDHGVFFLNVYCIKNKFFVTTNFLKWNLDSSEWEQIDFAKSSNLKIKIGTAKPISWSVKTEQNVGGTIINIPSLFVKKISSAKTILFPVKAGEQSYNVKFNVNGFSKFLPDPRDAGC